MIFKKTAGFIRIVAGIFFIILGIIGLFLPILQGVFFIVIGFSLLGCFWAKRLLVALKKKILRKKQ